MSGHLEVADIGLGDLVNLAARAWVVTDRDVAELLPPGPRAAHKWQSAVEVIGGSAEMTGAPLMSTRGALRAGAGYALLGIPGSTGAGVPPGEQVRLDLPTLGWDQKAAEAAARVRAVIVGPGLGSSAGGSGAAGSVGRFLASTSPPAVVDADALSALGDLPSIRQVVDSRSGPVVLTPHEGEYRRITGHAPRGSDHRCQGGCQPDWCGGLAERCPPPWSPTPTAALLVTSGSPRLATAGTGDVLSGIIGAFLARGLPVLEAAALAAHCHGRAASTLPVRGSDRLRPA